LLIYGNLPHFCYFQFYKQEVRLEEGIDVDNLFSGKGTTFTVKQENPFHDFADPKKPDLWDTNEISPIGIDPSAHKDVCSVYFLSDFTE
jgi:hypothetical protein